MKRTITTLHDALVFQLQGLAYAEKKIKAEFNLCKSHIKSSNLNSEIEKYIDSADNKLLKLERIFNYLMEEFTDRKNEVINKLLAETEQLLFYNRSSHLKNIIMISCLQNISAYKVSSFETAYMFASELELDTVADLLQQILEWEIETGKALSLIAIEEFNKIQITKNSETY